jgi:hypothetical protein
VVADRFLVEHTSKGLAEEVHNFVQNLSTKNYYIYSFRTNITYSNDIEAIGQKNKAHPTDISARPTNRESYFYKRQE